MSVHRLVPHSQAEEVAANAVKQHNEFVATLLRQLPYVSANAKQRLIANSKTQNNLFNLLQAFFFVEASGVEASERDGDLASVLAAHQAGWRIDLHRPVILEAVITHKRLSALGMKMEKQLAESVFSQAKSSGEDKIRFDLHEVFLSKKKGTKPLTIHDIQLNNVFTRYRFYGVWLALALFDEPEQKSLEWFYEEMEAEQLIFLGNTLSTPESQEDFVLSLLRVSNGAWVTNYVPLKVLVTEKMGIPIVGKADLVED